MNAVQTTPKATEQTGQVVLAAQALVKSVAAAAGEPIRIIDGVSLAIPRGRMVALTGPSGSGKTTLLCLLSGLLAPTEGVVEFDGQDLYAATDRELLAIRAARFGFVFQDFRLLPSLDVIDNVTLIRRLTSQQSTNDNALALLDALGLAHRAHAPISALSGGEKQRVAIARALLGSPAVLFADEPTAALDWEASRRVLDILRARAANAGAIVIIVTHDRRVVDSCDTELALEDGRMVTRHG